MVEVFKTNVHGSLHAKHLVNVIQYYFEDYKVNFDLDDCDRILRIEATKTIEVEAVILLLDNVGIEAELLSDEVPLIII
ncbi:MAG: hypothetical protein WDO15_09020 [Bacteroidota bacterium]